MKSRVIYFTKYSAAGPSSRYRSYQYFLFLRNEFDLVYHPLFDDIYIQKLYENKGHNIFKLIFYYFKRIFWVLRYLGSNNIFEPVSVVFLGSFMKKYGGNEVDTQTDLPSSVLPKMLIIWSESSKSFASQVNAAKTTIFTM